MGHWLGKLGIIHGFDGMKVNYSGNQLPVIGEGLLLLSGNFILVEHGRGVFNEAFYSLQS